MTATTPTTIRTCAARPASTACAPRTTLPLLDSRRRRDPPARQPAAARGEAAVRAPVRRRGAGSVAHEAVGADRPDAANGAAARASRRSRSPATPRSACSSTTASATGAACSRTSASRTSPSSRCASPTARRARSWPSRAPRWARSPTPSRPRPRAAAPRSRRSASRASGAAVAFLAEALRDLAAREPRATVALLARHPEQADRYYDGLRRAEVPSLRRVRAQEFAFRPGVEVTDVRQVKGLEFDYVVMLDVNASATAATTSRATCSTSASRARRTSSGWSSPPRPARCSRARHRCRAEPAFTLRRKVRNVSLVM